jgi:hypothetical protein
LHFVVRQHKPHKNKWNDVSLYNESGNFLGPAIFNTKREAQEYLKQYESRMLVRLAGVNNNTTPNNQQKRGGEKSNNDRNTKKNYDKRRKPGRRKSTIHEGIKLKVFEESTLPSVNTPSFFFHRSN